MNTIVHVSKREILPWLVIKLVSIKAGKKDKHRIVTKRLRENEI